MSRSIYIHCKSCGDSGAHEDWVSSAYESQLLDVLRQCRVIARLSDVTGLSLRVCGGNVPLDMNWFRTHCGHELVVRDEYGRDAHPLGALQ